LEHNSFLLLSFLPAATDIINGDAPPVWETQYGLPFFDNTTTKRDVIATVGQSAKLHCTVRNLGDRAVSVSNFLSSITSMRRNARITFSVN
jgi:hypothetical protein